MSELIEVSSLTCNHFTRDIRPHDCPKCNIFYLRNKINSLEKENAELKEMIAIMAGNKIDEQLLKELGHNND